MVYQINLDGAATNELTHLVHLVQKQLNGHGIGLAALMDGESSPGQAASSVGDCDPTKTCPNTTHPGHGPDVVIAIVSLVIGVMIGYYFGRRSTSRTLRP